MAAHAGFFITIVMCFANAKLRLVRSWKIQEHDAFVLEVNKYAG